MDCLWTIGKTENMATTLLLSILASSFNFWVKNNVTAHQVEIEDLPKMIIPKAMERLDDDLKHS